MMDPLKGRLLEVILLLLGVKVFIYSISFVGYVIPLRSDFGMIVMMTYPWIGKLIFALILMPQVWKISPKIAMAVGFQKGDNILEVLDKGSLFTDIAHEQWRQQLLDYRIVSFWGTTDTVSAVA